MMWQWRGEVYMGLVGETLKGGDHLKDLDIGGIRVSHSV
jgi:hypothetical protein